MIKQAILIIASISLIVACVFLLFVMTRGFSKNGSNQTKSGFVNNADKGVIQYPVHKNITATLFWIGENANESNKQISNVSSAWDESWVDHFGGVDDPKKRNGYFPANFMPHENPFYFALPYNDLDKNGVQKNDVQTLVPWAKNRSPVKTESLCKNMWIKIIHGDKIAYAQWEDVGPFSENDSGYVFGDKQPHSNTNDSAGLDLSPAVNDYLALNGLDTVEWQFIDARDVPKGPWKDIITTSGVFWKK